MYRRMCMYVCKAGFWDIRDLVLRCDVRHSMRRYICSEIHYQCAEVSVWTRDSIFFPCFMSDQKILFIYKLCFVFSYVTWFAHGMWPVANRLDKTMTDSMQPVLPQQADICESQQHCQHLSTQQIVNVIGAVSLSLYLSLIQAHTGQQTILWQQLTVVLTSDLICLG